MEKKEEVKYLENNTKVKVIRNFHNTNDIMKKNMEKFKAQGKKPMSIEEIKKMTEIKAANNKK
ncbi:MAG: hypothetical protein KBD28_03575 [Chitinophagaceae bacterium]|nr:hypothetical protein [Chitinophagaceae bacterium]